MKIYLVKTNDYNCIIFTEGAEYIVKGSESDGILDGAIDIYADDAADQLRAYFQNLDDNGELNDFDEMPGEREEISHEIIGILADSEIIFSSGRDIEIYSVETAPDFNDDTFNGNLEECEKYCKENELALGQDAQISKILLDDKFCVIECLEIIGTAE